MVYLAIIIGVMLLIQTVLLWRIKKQRCSYTSGRYTCYPSYSSGAVNSDTPRVFRRDDETEAEIEERQSK